MIRGVLYRPQSTVRRQSALALAVLVAVVAAFVAASSPAGAAETTATLSPRVSTWLAAAPADATLETVVTFHARDGIARLDALGVPGVRLRELPMALTVLSPAQVREVASWPEVRSVWHNARLDILLDESVALTKADKVKRGEGVARAAGYTGAGIGVAVIDTGVDSLHPDLLGKVEGYVAQGDLFEENDRNKTVMAPMVAGDTYGHGTHVASTIAGTGRAHTANEKPFDGMAPGAKIYSFKTDTGLYLYGGPILVSFDWMLEHNRLVDAGLKAGPKVHVSSNSWGGGDGTNYNPDDPINVATKALYDSGVNVVFAASNSGGPNTLNQYATSPWVISVAAGTKTLGLATFSSRGRCDGDAEPCMRDDPATKGDDVEWNRRDAQKGNTGLYRPTVTAPGADIEAAKSSEAVVMASGTDPVNPMYTYASGTSMATPHVAGAIALMLEARPKLKPQHVIDILEATADDMPAYETFEVGLGHLDALEAVQAAEKGKVVFPPSIKGKTPEYVQTSSASFGGEVASGTWLVRKCSTTEIPPGLSQHKIAVASGTDVIYTEIEWADPNQLIYLVIYDPECNVAGESAALLDIGSVNHRALMVTNPAPGTWTVGVYGRINLPTRYTGSFSTFDAG